MCIFILLDILAVAFNMFAALVVRFEFRITDIPAEYLNSVAQYFVFNVITTLIITWVLKLYHSVWTYAGAYEVRLILTSNVLTTAFMALGMDILEMKVPRSYYIFYFLFNVATTIVTRFAYRFFRQMKQRSQRPNRDYIRTMVIGAGDAGNMIIKELQNSKHLRDKVVCVIDDSPTKKGKYINGIEIVGGRDRIVESARKYKVDQIIIALPSVSKKETKDIIRICHETSCKLKVLPGMYQLIKEEVIISQLREVSIEDLLGRDSVQIDLDSVKGYLRNKVVMVTGGGGSIGSELCRQIAKCRPKCLIIYDIYENNAYDIQQELKKQHPNLHLEVLIGSVRNTSRIESVMQLYRPNIVFHAAAHKHVPLMEDSPNEAIKNNVFGTYKTARAADKYGVEKFVLISTDKAVNPTNIMGASKRMCEMIIQMFSRHSKTEYVAVRFGNVLGSNGSVIPLFKKQIAEGGPVTVTHPDIIRYFMTIPEAVSLVLQAGAYARGGEIFVLDMGEPVRIADLAKNLIRLSGYTLGVDMNIEYTGLRPGEKLFEELLIEEEGLQKTENELIFIGKPLEFDEDEFLKNLGRLEEAIAEERFDVKEIVSEIIPTYHIRKEDKERYTAIYDEFCKLGRVSHEQPIMKGKNE
ncbi:MAG: polysaccharide biosynthesis protein [Agathobacter sp.]|nr:polysaccharide biosynthesis protein [Agathobacter sp.]